ncbi:hypothetical protein EHF_0396 [Ehrlichia japonica]|uniref:Uncharacterized protein n=1 Tax=Ehrlichia japonica TaxID=391036 RepID=X5GL95_9RICK|nr:hypothetical protein EHF_0396 [Ehrlichia japonica]
MPNMLHHWYIMKSLTIKIIVSCICSGMFLEKDFFNYGRNI